MRHGRSQRHSCAMTTTTDPFGGFAPPPPPPSTGQQPPSRVLRRSHDDRVAAGVAGGLGEYFSVDPVLFRVLFATAAFFGGAGVLAYLLAWAAIPEQGTVHAPIDRFIHELRRRRVPVWLVAGGAGLLLWAIAFSWWAPGPFFPVIVVVIILVAIFGRRGRRGHLGPLPPAPAPSAVSLEKDAGAAGPSTESPVWMGETRQWITEAREASRLRRRRALPVRLATLGVLVVTLAILGAVDAASGIAIPVYLWVTLGIVVGALLVGMALRRTPWSIATLIVPSVIGLVAFGGTSSQLHDGFGQRDWTPTSAAAIDSTYRLAFGQGVLDLRNVGTLQTARTVNVRIAAGQVRIVVPPTMNVTVEGNVHLGNITVDGNDYNGSSGWRSRGFSVDRTILPPSTATGVPLTIDVHVADGNISVEHRN